MTGERHPRTIPTLLALRREQTPDVRAVVSPTDAITYRELDDASAVQARRLLAAGVEPGQRVALLAPNGTPWVVLAVAVMRTGAVLVPLSTLMRPPELIGPLDVARVGHVIASRSFRSRDYVEEVRSLVAEVPAVRQVWAMDDLPRAEAAPERLAEVEARVTPDDDMAVLFTSGSRGAPKGTIHRHGGALGATASGLAARCVGADEVLYIPMPFFWTGGFSGGLVTALVAGATLLTEAEPEPAQTLELLRRERATLFRGWPDQAARLAAHPDFPAEGLASLRDGSLAAVLPPARRPAPGARANLFGMSESFGPYCGDRLDRDLPPGTHGSCGRPFDAMEVRISDPDSGDEVPAGAEGEIWLRGPHLMRGICGRETSEVFTADGYYRTGDLGRRDADGYLWFVGRLDDMFKVSGATVYPAEVERALLAVPGVRAAHVTDVEHDGATRVGALVVTDLPAVSVHRDVRRSLSAFKVPTRWVVTPDPAAVPRLGSGKADTAALRQMLTEQGSGVVD